MKNEKLWNDWWWLGPFIYFELLNIITKYAWSFLFSVRLCIYLVSIYLSILVTKIRGDVRSVRYKFETGAFDNMTWIRRQSNLADPMKKKDSSLTNTQQLKLFTGRLCVDFGGVSETNLSEKLWLKKEGVWNDWWWLRPFMYFELLIIISHYASRFVVYVR